MTQTDHGEQLGRIRPSSHDDAWYVKVTDGVPQGFPAVLGLTDPPQASSFTFPRVEVIPLGTTGKVTFAASTSADSTAYTSTSVTEMRHPLGKRKLFAGPVGLERYITEHAPRAEGQIPATGDYDTLKKVVIEVVKPTLALLTWELGSELEIDAMSDNELLVEMAGDPTGKTKMWNGATVKLDSVAIGPASGDLAGQTYYRAKIIDVGPMGLADDLNQFVKPIAGCDMKKKG